MRHRTFPLAALAISMLSAASTTHAQRPDARSSADGGTEQACAHSGHGRHHGRRGHGRHAEGPMAVPGTTVRAENTRNGVALVFTTTGDVEELRRRVNARAEHRARRMVHHREHDHGRRAHARAPRATATVENVRGGVRLVLTPNDAADLEALRTRMREKAARMSARGSHR